MVRCRPDRELLATLLQSIKVPALKAFYKSIYKPNFSMVRHTMGGGCPLCPGRKAHSLVAVLCNTNRSAGPPRRGTTRS